MLLITWDGEAFRFKFKKSSLINLNFYHDNGVHFGEVILYYKETGYILATASGAEEEVKKKCHHYLNQLAPALYNKANEVLNCKKFIKELNHEL